MTRPSTRAKRLRIEGWEYFKPLGIPRELYDAGTVDYGEWVCTITFTHKENGSTLELNSVYFGDDGEILQACVDVMPKLF